MIRKSQTFNIVVYVLGLIVLGFAFLVIMKPLGMLHDSVYNDPNLSDDVYQIFFIKTQTIWKWILPVLAAVMIIWLLVEAQKKSDLYGGG